MISVIKVNSFLRMLHFLVVEFLIFWRSKSWVAKKTCIWNYGTFLLQRHLYMLVQALFGVFGIPSRYSLKSHRIQSPYNPVFNFISAIEQPKQLFAEENELNCIVDHTKSFDPTILFHGSGFFYCTISSYYGLFIHGLFMLYSRTIVLVYDIVYGLQYTHSSLIVLWNNDDWSTVNGIFLP